MCYKHHRVEKEGNTKAFAWKEGGIADYEVS